MKLQIITNPKRMLDEKEAADYCGLPLSRFKRVCPVQTVKFATGDERLDVRDLDGWLDGLKASNDDAEAIVEKLA